MKCTYCGCQLPEPCMDGIIYACVKGGIDDPVPVCRTCLAIPANKLAPIRYKKINRREGM